MREMHNFTIFDWNWDMHLSWNLYIDFTFISDQQFNNYKPKVISRQEFSIGNNLHLGALSGKCIGHCIQLDDSLPRLDFDSVRSCKLVLPKDESLYINPEKYSIENL